MSDRNRMTIADLPYLEFELIDDIEADTCKGGNTSSDGSDSTQALRDIMTKGAQESVAIAKIQLESQRVANVAKAWQGFASMKKSGAQGLSQVG
jgi:hypothetical protein